MRRSEGNPLFSNLNFQVPREFFGVLTWRELSDYPQKKETPRSSYLQKHVLPMGKGSREKHSYGLDDNPVPYFLKVFLVLLIARHVKLMCQ